MKETGDSKRQDRPPRGLQWFLLLAGLCTVAAIYLSAISFGRAEWGTNHTAFFVLGLSLISLALLARVLPLNATLFSASTSVALLVSLSVLLALGIDPFLTLGNLRLRLFPPKVGIWQFDPKFGFSHIPGAQGVDEQNSFTVSYTIDKAGFRATPTPEDAAGRITFLGCSFTFGTGVENDECYPFRLASRHWKEDKVRNRAVSGWGTAHAYLSILEELEEPELPKLILYGWIPHHERRTYIRRDWVTHLANPWTNFETPLRINEHRKHPHFEIEGGELIYKGVVGFDDNLVDPPDLKRREKDLTHRFIEEMAVLSEKKNVPFVLVALPMRGDPPYEPPEHVTSAIEKTNCTYIDARNAARGFIPGDSHPDAATHAAIADLIADATVVREILAENLTP